METDDNSPFSFLKNVDGVNGSISGAVNAIDTERAARIAGMFRGAVAGSAIGAQYAYNHETERVAPDEWGTHADIALVVMNARMHGANPDDFIYTWLREGIPEIDKPSRPTLPAKIVWAHPDFHNGICAHDAAARAIYEKSAGKFASMCPLARMLAIAVDQPHPDLVERMCTTTHVDPRVIAVSQIFTAYLSALIAGTRPDPFPAICEEITSGRLNLSADDQRDNTPFGEIIGAISLGESGAIAKLGLAQMGRETHIVKAAALISYVHKVIEWAHEQDRRPDFEKIIYTIAQQHGHAEANCMIAGALLGAAGVQVPAVEYQKEWLDAITQTFSAITLR